MKNIIIVLIVIILVALGGYFLLKDSPDGDVRPDDDVVVDDEPVVEDEPNGSETKIEGEEVIGASVEGRDITAFHYGTGETELLFVAGIHGGYSWNTPLVGFELVDYLEASPDVVPENVRVTVVPVMNPDGLNEAVGTDGRFTRSDVPASQSVLTASRFNANDVDLNRNFDCEWQATGKWQNKDVSGGSAPFSEPETQAMRDYIQTNQPDAVVVYYSAAGGVYASSCNNGILPETREIMNTYANAAGYSAHEEFDFYEITGDMVNWLAKNNIPGISVLLTDHQNTEWSKNRAGIEALLNHYAE